MRSAPAYNIPKNFTGIVTDSYCGTDVLLGYVDGQVLRGKSGGLRKFKFVNQAEKAVEKEEAKAS